MNRRRSLLLALLLVVLLVGGGLFVALDAPGAPGDGPVDEAALPDGVTRGDGAGGDPGVSGHDGERFRRERRRAEPEDDLDPEEPETVQPSAGPDAPEGGSEGPNGPKTGAARPAGSTPRGDHPMSRSVTKRTAGTVVDAETGEPIAGARIRFAVMKGNMPAGWSGATSAADGSFEVLARAYKELANAPRELIVDAAGYLIFRMGSPGEGVVARLERQTEPEVPGTIAGIISHAPGKPVTGPVLIQGTGEYGSYAAQWVIAGEDGSYRMEGVPPRYWNLWMPSSVVPVLVPPGGEATTALITTGNGDSKGGSGVRRTVVVTGLPDDARDGATLRAEVKPRLFWRTVTADGKATLELPVGEWTLVLSWGIDREIRRPLDFGVGEFGAGDGVVAVDFSAPLPEAKRAVVERRE